MSSQGVGYYDPSTQGVYNLTTQLVISTNDSEQFCLDQSHNDTNSSYEIDFGSFILGATSALLAVVVVKFFAYAMNPYSAEQISSIEGVSLNGQPYEIPDRDFG